MMLIQVLPCACVREAVVFPDKDDDRFLRMTFSAEELRPVVKSGEPNAGIPEESALRQIQVWVFNADSDDFPLAVKEVSGAELSRLVDSYGDVTMTVAIDRRRLDPRMLLDIYVAANASGSGLNLFSDSRPSDLDAALLTCFSPSDATGTVPPGGLPISRVVKRVDGRQHLCSAHSPAPPIMIPLVRAVSKIRFYLVRPNGLFSARIERIVIDGNCIGREAYFFPEPVQYAVSIPDPSQPRLREAGGYHSTPLQLEPQDADLCSYPAPEMLRRQASENIGEYVVRVQAAAVHPFGVTYLKESDKALTGTIYYTMGISGSQVREAHFHLEPGCFIRNHEWIVYAYFSKDRLYVCPEIAPWTDAGAFSFDWNYTYTLTNQTGATHTRILDDGDADYVMCAYGTGSDGLPYSPKLQIDRWSSIPVQASMLLLADNPDFGLIEEDGGVLSPIKDHINMPLDTTARSTVFYVVPRHPFDLAGPHSAHPQTKLKLLLNSAGLASIRLPFNMIDLPGDTETIRYHYVTPDRFR